jgi:hypothetical protein
MGLSSAYDRVVLKNSLGLSDNGSFLKLVKAISLLNSKHLPRTVCKLCINGLIPEARITFLVYFGWSSVFTRTAYMSSTVNCVFCCTASLSASSGFCLTFDFSLSRCYVIFDNW